MITVEGLGFRYRSRKLPALKEISFELADHESLLILGPSGSGKSTLALCLNGAIPNLIDGEFTGRAQVSGLDTRYAPMGRLTSQVGLVFQEPETQFCMLKVRDEVAFGLENLAVPRTEMDARIDLALDKVGLGDCRQRKVHELSGGQQQRLALACILAMEPGVLVFDEPTSNLDPAGSREVFDTIRRLHSTGQYTIVLVEHRLDEAMDMVDKVLLIDRTGGQIAFGPPSEVFRRCGDWMAEQGVWLPQVTELARRIEAANIYRFADLPLTVDEAATALGPIVMPKGPSANAGQRLRSSKSIVTRPAVSVSDLSYRYPNGVSALSHLNLEVDTREFFALVGPNGCGKTTLARHVVGVLPTGDKLSLFGTRTTDLPTGEINRTIGHVFQNPEHQFLASTVYDELALGLRLRKRPEVEVRPPVEMMLEEFGLLGLARAHPFTLSHGEKRRLSVATELILGQQILILDEPTFGQDRRNSDLLMGKLAELNKAGRTIIVISHDLRMIVQYSGRVGAMANGQIIFQGSSDDLLADKDTMDRCSLSPPPLVALARRLSGDDRARSVATIDDFLSRFDLTETSPLFSRAAMPHTTV